MKRGKKLPTHQHPRSSLPPVHTPVHHIPEKHPHRVKHLLYVITFLLILLVLIVFFSFPLSYGPEETPPLPTSYSLEIPSLTCTWEKDSFLICATVVWGGTDALFAKSYIPGGESLELSPPQTTSPFTYCQSAGAEEGYRVVRAMLYSSTGLVRDIGQGVSCTGTSPSLSIPIISKPATSIFTTTADFRTYSREISYPRGSGSFTRTFPAPVESCTFTGSWITDNDLFKHNSFCHRARGTFEGYADASGQYVINDPDLFYWADLSQPRLNPPAQRYDDSSFRMELCDNEYYRKGHIPRYGVQGRIEGFGTKTLSFVWNYFDDSNARPAVDFNLALTCVLRPT